MPEHANTNASVPPALHELESEVMQLMWQLGEVNVRRVLDELNVVKLGVVETAGEEDTTLTLVADTVSLFGNDLTEEMVGVPSPVCGCSFVAPLIVGPEGFDRQCPELSPEGESLAGGAQH